MAENEEKPKSLLRVKEETEKAGLKLSIKKSKIMPFGPISSWQKEGEKVEAMSDFTFLGSKITVDGDCSLLLGRKAMTNVASILKSRDITLLTKIHIVKAMVFPVVTYREESWSIKKVKPLKNWCSEIMVLEKTLESSLGCNEIKSVNLKGTQP